LLDLRTRGVNQIDQLVTDGHDGLLAAVASLFPAMLRQRCLVHKQRNVMNAIPKREQQEVATELTGIHERDELTDDCLGGDARYPLAQDPGRLESQEADDQLMSNHPARLVQERMFFAILPGHTRSTRRAFPNWHDLFW
jgi:hypothetical protein